MNANTMAHRIWTAPTSWRAIWRTVAKQWRQPEFSSLNERRRTIAELERLAETSPHLLADAGMVQDRQTSDSGAQIWRSETLNLVAVIEDTRAQVTDTVPVQR